MLHLGLVKITNLPQQQLAITAQAQQMVPQAQQLQDSPSMPDVYAFPAKDTPCLQDHPLADTPPIGIDASGTTQHKQYNQGNPPVHSLACDDVAFDSGKHQISFASQRLYGVRQLGAQYMASVFSWTVSSTDDKLYEIKVWTTARTCGPTRESRS